ncbi:hypothetical protein HJ581_0026880 [Rhodococcus opacus]|nr:hypothetical protein HJ581_0026880 [Rhodococcus opacus]
MTTPVGQSARYEIQSCPDIEFGRPDGHILRLDLSLPIGVAAPPSSSTCTAVVG